MQTGKFPKVNLTSCMNPNGSVAGEKDEKTDDTTDIE